MGKVIATTLDSFGGEGRERGCRRAKGCIGRKDPDRGADWLQADMRRCFLVDIDGRYGVLPLGSKLLSWQIEAKFHCLYS
jgi:hypothetical protein